MKAIETPHWEIDYDDRGIIFESVEDPEAARGGGSWPAMIELAIAILQNAPGAIDPDVHVVRNGCAPLVRVDGGMSLLNVNYAYIRAIAILRAAREVNEAYKQIGAKP